MTEENSTQAAAMAGAVWSGLRLKRAEDGTYTFPYSGRTYRLERAVAGKGWVLAIGGPFGAHPFTEGMSWPGMSREAAVRLMVAEAYGAPCPDGYTTGVDSCPGCDAYDETFESAA